MIVEFPTLLLSKQSLTCKLYSSFSRENQVNQDKMELQDLKDLG